jgi:hypothetical protein
MSSTDGNATPQSLFESVLYASLPWPRKTTWLERDTVRDFSSRPASARIAIAELYHENSKLFAQTFSELGAMRLDASQVRREFVRRRAVAFRGVAEGDEQPTGPLRALFTSLSETVDQELYYAVEMRMALPPVLLLHEPLGDRLIAYKKLSGEEEGRLDAALAPWRRETRPAATVFVVGSFARNELLFGARGYRHTLLEAGQLIQQALGLAAHNGLAASPLCDFIDRDIDALLEADGVEEGVLAVIELGG